MTQEQRIVRYINQFGSISTFEAFTELGITRLASRILDLTQEGYAFDRESVTDKNRFGEPVRYTRYRFNEQSQKR